MKHLLPGHDYVVAIPGPGQIPEKTLQGVLDLFEANGANVTLVPFYGLSVIEIIEIPSKDVDWRISPDAVREALTLETITASRPGRLDVRGRVE